MPCPFRVILIVCAAFIALAAAILALRSPVEIDVDGNERPVSSSFTQRPQRSISSTVSTCFSSLRLTVCCLSALRCTQTRSVREHMRDFYDESVRPWLPEWLGGYKSIESDAAADEAASRSSEQHGKAD